jgi:hypothetical protein
MHPDAALQQPAIDLRVEARARVQERRGLSVLGTGGLGHRGDQEAEGDRTADDGVRDDGETSVVAADG